MRVLVCYDVQTTDPKGPQRLRRIAKACLDFGLRVQFSLFECNLQPKDWVSLKARLLDELNPECDSLRIYFLQEQQISKTEHYGVRQPADVTELLLVE